ncbi:hypothetical protein SAMN05216596_10291 [Pseudomonas congelans]|uniref:HrpO n=1 Tax=Pseudomonas congelans TaxID=200452 RepID=A0A0N8R0T5_9PSED|nr:hypothetical protein [Pseudomonas congelans]KFE48530.1 hypothetical protein IV03_04055 [Pseudomonas congelans]KPW82086.1 HrpO [Pseudomonas congelans]MCF5165694.1 hypothetical protein [Pseudomonas congelans]PBP88536.1 hypothetical protein CCL07_26385 [Pseudomonas congelans]SDO87531.1 hypothetical protein SAMN05216596_10291 [Pseudomonas congelans]
MRRRVAVEEAAPDPDPQRDALVEVVALLTPLRERRKNSLERRCREEQEQISRMQAAIELAEQECVEDLRQQRQERKALALQCEGQVMSINGIQQWQQQEQQLMDRQTELRLHTQRLNLELENQQLRAREVQTELRASQRALEKLACLRETLA